MRREEERQRAPNDPDCKRMTFRGLNQYWHCAKWCWHQKFTRVSSISGAGYKQPDELCVALAATAPATLSMVRALTRGTKGKVTLTISSAAVPPRSSNGKCDESPSAVALGEVTR